MIIQTQVIIIVKLSKVEYFGNVETVTPQTTPSNKSNTNQNFSLKQVNFNEYIDVIV